MTLKKVIGSMAAMALGVTSIASSAYAAPVANPAASLSIGSTARVGTVSGHKSKIAGIGPVYALLIVAGVVAIGVIAATRSSSSNTPASR